MLPRRHIAFLGCSVSIGAFSAFNNFTLSLWLTNYVASYVLISLLANTRGFAGSLVSPLAGAWSDRVWLGRLGRRRPFILVGGLLAAALLALTPTIARMRLPPALGGLPPEVLRLAPLVVIIFVVTVAWNTMDDIHKALLPDLTEGAGRNRLSSFMVAVEMSAQVAFLVLGAMLWQAGIPDSAFLVTAGFVVAGVLLTVVGVREPPPEEWVGRRRGAAAPAESRLPLSALVGRYRDAAIFCLVIFAYWSGVNAVLPLVSIYTRDVLGVSEGEAQFLPALMLLSTTLTAVPVGWLGTRAGKRRVIGAGYAIMVAAALAGILITTREQGMALFLFAGVGNAASMVLTIPLMADLVPRHHMGAAAGILAAAGGIAAPVSSLIAGGLSDVYGPRAIFAVMAGMVAVALLLLSRVHTQSGGRAETVFAGEYS